MTLLPNAIYRFKCDPYQITNGMFHRTRTKKFKHQRPQIVKTVLRKKNGVGVINIPKFKVRNFLTTKPQSSRQYGTGTKTEIYTYGTR